MKRFLFSMVFVIVLLSSSYADTNQAAIQMTRVPPIPPKLWVQTAEITLTEGNIDSFLIAEAQNSWGDTKHYQWYYMVYDYGHNYAHAISGATNAVFNIPKSLTALGSPYYYYCEADMNGGDYYPTATYQSNLVTVVITPTEPTPTGTDPVPTSTEPTQSNTQTTNDSGGGCNGVVLGNGAFFVILALLTYGLWAGERKRNKRKN